MAEYEDPQALKRAIASLEAELKRHDLSLKEIRLLVNQLNAAQLRLKQLYRQGAKPGAEG